ncbi:MAG: hypothetical protein HY297_02530 [Thaumarchaeota archaeon]|nr:hypothetical protein [Nitrososphaerota archaeon]
MIMKPTAVASASVAAVLSYINPLLGFLFVFFFALFFSTMGVLKSWAAHLRLANDAPNALRALLAAAGGALLPFGAQFLLQSTGVFLILGAVFLNDEYQRRVFAAAGRGKRGGTVALLGIDGSGKSTHAEALGSWFSARGYEYSNVPFHRYLFVGAFARSASGDLESKGRRRGGNPLRPVLSLIDNLALHLVTAFGVGLEGKVVVFDRYIWSTYVKYASLGYPVRPLRRL